MRNKTYLGIMTYGVKHRVLMKDLLCPGNQEHKLYVLTGYKLRKMVETII